MPAAPLPRRLWLYPSWGLLAAACAIALVAPRAIDEVRYVPLLAGLVLFGLPHGAVDHLVPGWLRGAPLPGRQLAAVLGAYAAAALAGVALWFAFPLLALAVFLALAVLHWGQGELWFALACAGRRRPRGPLSLALFTGVRGLLPVAVPLLAFPAAASVAASDILARFGHDGLPALGSQWRVGLLAAIGAAGGCAAVASVLEHRGAPGALARDLGELGLLAAFFATVPPVFAVGLYFVAWHSPRHVARLLATDPRAAARLRAGRPGAALARFARTAAPCTALALLGLAALAALVAGGTASAGALVATLLALIAALTAPHVVVVAWMDAAQGLWVAPAQAPRPAGVRSRSAA